MASIAIISADENHIIGFTMSGNVDALNAAMRANDPAVCRVDSVDTRGDWPSRFDRVMAPCGGRWRSYAPSDLPSKFWRR